MHNEERINSILMTCYYSDLVSAPDCSCREWNLFQPIRSTTKIWVVTRHQYGTSALVRQTSSRGETSSGVRKVDRFLKLQFVFLRGFRCKRNNCKGKYLSNLFRRPNVFTSEPPTPAECINAGKLYIKWNCYKVFRRIDLTCDKQWLESIQLYWFPWYSLKSKYAVSAEGQNPWEMEKRRSEG